MNVPGDTVKLSLDQPRCPVINRIHRYDILITVEYYTAMKMNE